MAGKLAVTGTSPTSVTFAHQDSWETSAGAAASPPAPPADHPSAGHQSTDLRQPAGWEHGSGGRPDQRVPSVLVSTIVHTIVLILLALWTYQDDDGAPRVSVAARQGEPSDVASLKVVAPQEPSPTRDPAPADDPVSVTLSPSDAVAVSSPLLATSGAAMPEVAFPTPSLAEEGSPQQDFLQRLPSGGLSGRSPSRRSELGRRFGATPESERAVELALQWLAAHQRRDGSWSFDLTRPPCESRCDNSRQRGKTATPATAATGLALLAFLGAGNTDHEGPYAENVRRGLYYLRGNSTESRPGLDWQQGNMYGHGIALMAMSEALTMTIKGDLYDKDLYEQVRRGASFTCYAQHPNGSWGYVPGSPGDTTLTAWQVLSLLEAHRNHVPLGTNTLSDAKEFLLSTSPDGSYAFGYQGPPAEPTTTAIGLTMMLYLGENPTYTPMFKALNALAERGPTLTNVYHDYYGTLALHHARHRGWDRWNQRLRDHLVATQASSGHERGSWHFEDRWGDVGGRLYTTAMCTMILEVYYRFLPLYDTHEEFPL